MKRMQQVLGRSKRAIQHAFQNILFQQFIHHPAPKVAEAYDMHMNDLIEGFVDPKYYQPLENELAYDYQVQDTDDEDADTNNESDGSWLHTLMFGLLTVSSIYYYAQVLIQKQPTPFACNYLP